MRAGISTLVTLGAALGLACSDNTSPNTNVIHVVLTPSVDSLEIGDTARISFTPIDANGKQVSGLTVALASENPAIATVSNSGLVQAISAGETRISATTGTITDFAVITVLQAVQDTIPTVTSVLATAAAITDSVTITVLAPSGAVSRLWRRP